MFGVMGGHSLLQGVGGPCSEFGVWGRSSALSGPPHNEADSKKAMTKGNVS